MRPLLLLVDLQGDFLDAPGLEPGAGGVVGGAARLLGEFRRRGLPVAHVLTTVTLEPETRPLHWRAGGVRRCVAGTPGWEPPAGLAPRPGEPVFHKRGFDPFLEPGLGQHLQSRGVDTVVVAGVHLHACVRQAVLGAYERGLSVWVAGDATGSDDPLHAAAVRRHLARRAASFLPVAAVLERLESGLPLPAPGGAGSAGVEVPPPPRAALARVPVSSRVEAVLALAGELERDAPALARLMAEVIGKPVAFGEPEVRRSAAMLRRIVERVQSDARTNHGDRQEVRHRPLGTVAVVTPWNNPFYIPLGKLAPALLYGNSVAWKPAPAAQPLAEELHRRLSRHLPELEACLTVVPGGAAVAERLMEDPGIHAVTLTGSLETGRAAAAVCALRHLPCQAELGGNNAAIVWEDADLDVAARKIAEGAFALAGQRCTANRRVIVPEARHDEFVEKLMAAARGLRQGPPQDAETRIGPLVGQAQRERLEALLERARAAGLEVRPVFPGAGRARSQRPPGAWLDPVVVPGADPGHELVREESFGPVLVVQRCGGFDEALALLNGVPQGLAGAVFTTSARMVEAFLEEARAGILKVNESTADAGLDLPFGGWKASGMGPPEHGRFDREFFTRPQTVYGGGAAR